METLFDQHGVKQLRGNSPDQIAITRLATIFAKVTAQRAEVMSKMIRSKDGNVTNLEP